MSEGTIPVVFTCNSCKWHFNFYDLMDEDVCLCYECAFDERLNDGK